MVFDASKYQRGQQMVNDPQIAGFELIDRVGEGGMSEVWKARQLSLDRMVAIKLLPSASIHDTVRRRRIKTEAYSAARLKHPGIVQVHDASIERDMSYIVMEYVAGSTLASWIKRRGYISEREALAVAESVADALGYAYTSSGMIHCDIKPENILIDSDGTIKIADMGISRIAGQGGAATADAMCFGTPAYMSPEQAQGTEDLDCRADIYSLGATLYEILTGNPLFAGCSAEEVMEMQLTSTVPNAGYVHRGRSLGILKLLEKMLAKDRNERYRDWREVLADIKRVRRGLLPLHSLPPDAISTMRKFQPPRIVYINDAARRLKNRRIAAIYSWGRMGQ